MIDAEPLESLQHRRSAKWRSFPADVLPLPVAEMDFPIAEPIKQVLTEMVAHSDTGYLGAVPELSRAFADYSALHWGWEVDTDQFRVVTDVGVAGVEVLRVLCAPGDTVVVNSPVYHNFYNWITEAKCVARDVPLAYRGDGVWDLDFEGLERAFAEGASAYILCNPHNPVGTVFCREHLEQVAELAARYNVVVISDEIHAPLNYTSTPFMPYLNVNDQARATGLCITAASKSWNLAGLKCAQIVTADDRMKARLDAMPISVGWRASLLGAFGSATAYAHGQPWLDDVMVTLTANRAWLAEQLAQRLPKAIYHVPESTYLAWIDLRGYGIDNPAKVLLDKGRVALNDGATFGPDGVGFVRLNFATSTGILDEALTRMERVLE